jgi:hypothetical protein
MTAGTAQSNKTGMFDSSSIAHGEQTLARRLEFHSLAVSVRIFPLLPFAPKTSASPAASFPEKPFAPTQLVTALSQLLGRSKA